MIKRCARCGKEITKDDSWEQIPVAPLYEINKSGIVRNIQTKRIIKPWIPKDRKHDKQVFLRINRGDRRTKSFHVAGLLWLTHGIIPKRKTHSRIVVPVIVSHGNNERYFFDSMRQAAKFLAPRIPLTARRIHNVLCTKRPKELDGWRINYQR